MIRVIVVVARLRQTPLVLKLDTSHHRSWRVLQLVKKESVTAVQPAFRTQSHMELPSRVHSYAWYKKFEQKGRICKVKSPGQSSVCDALSSESWVATATNKRLQNPACLLMKPYKLRLIQALKSEDWPCDTNSAARSLTGLKTTTCSQGSSLVTRRLSVWTVNWIGIMSVFGEQKMRSLSGTKEIHQKFVENTVTCNSYVDIHTLWLLPQLEGESNECIFWHDGGRLSSAWLFGTAWKSTFPGDGSVVQSNWLRVVRMAAEIARLNSVRLHLVGLHKRKGFVTPLPQSLLELRQRLP
jgi:hypothetical protein